MRDIKYPIFSEASKYIQDPYWVDIFLSLAHDKNIPKCIYIKGNNIINSGNKSNFNYSFIDKPPQLIAIELQEILRSNTNIASTIDNNKNNELNNLNNKHIIHEKWSSIRKKSQKDELIMNYILHMKKEYNLTEKNAINLYKLINVGFVLKYQCSNDVKLINGEISKINGIEYNEKQKSFINTHTNDDLYEEEYEKDNKYFFYFWSKYVYNNTKIL